MLLYASAQYSAKGTDPGSAATAVTTGEEIVRNNDILRRLRFAIRLDDPTMLGLFSAGGTPVGQERLDSWFADEGSPDYAELDDRSFATFLDGLILRNRGSREPGGSAAGGGSSGAAGASPGAAGTSSGAAGTSSGAASREAWLDNNLILKKLRIAFELKEEDLVAIFAAAGMSVTGNELTALFRKKGHKNYRECMDQYLRGFLVGLGRWRSLRA